MPTPHNSAEKGEIAKTVFMSGDPLRVQFMAETYLKDPREFNHVRGMLGYTGFYKGKPVSVMGSGMGIPSMGIYSYELFTYYDVDNIIRIGSAGAYDNSLRLYDVMLVIDTYSDSAYAFRQNGFTGHITKPAPVLLAKLRGSAGKLGYPLVEGRVHCSDVFYYDLPNGQRPEWQRTKNEQNCIAVDMESFALFHNAAITGKNAACLLTVSDLVDSKEETSPEERQKGFSRMMEIALGILEG
jgi:purine-nucleoside phosphorylase